MYGRVCIFTSAKVSKEVLFSSVFVFLLGSRIIQTLLGRFSEN